MIRILEAITKDDQGTIADEMHVSPAFSNTNVVRSPFIGLSQPS